MFFISLTYKPFEEVYGTLTSEKDRLSLRSDGEKRGHGIPFSLNAQTVRRSVLCSECLKPRIIYAQHKLTHQDQTVLDRLIHTCIHVEVR